MVFYPLFNSDMSPVLEFDFYSFGLTRKVVYLLKLFTNQSNQKT